MLLSLRTLIKRQTLPVQTFSNNFRNRSFIQFQAREQRLLRLCGVYYYLGDQHQNVNVEHKLLINSYLFSIKSFSLQVYKLMARLFIGY